MKTVTFKCTCFNEMQRYSISLTYIHFAIINTLKLLYNKNLARLTEEVQPDYVVLTLPIGKTPQENPIRKPDKKEKNPTRKPDKKEIRIQQILEFCTEPRSSSDILEMLGLKDKENLMEVYINPMIAENLLSMTEPDNPTSRNQMYITIKAAKF